MRRQRPFQGLGILVALVLALMATLIVLLAPLKQGATMWTFYIGAAGVLIWVAIDLWAKLRQRRGNPGEAPFDALDTDAMFRAAPDAEALAGTRDGSDIPADRANWRSYDEGSMPAPKPLREL